MANEDRPGARLRRSLVGLAVALALATGSMATPAQAQSETDAQRLGDIAHGWSPLEAILPVLLSRSAPS